MSYETLLQRHATRTSEPAAGDRSPAEPETTEDLGSFGWLRGIRDRAVMLELRKKDGNIMAVGYGWLERAEFDPSEEITLWIAGRKISIQGRNLNAEIRPMVRLFEGIVRHRVPWIRESDQAESMEAAEKATVVEGIEW
jgi:hypothetical protein